MPIVMSEVSEGIHYFRPMPMTSNFVFSAHVPNPSTLWHILLGYLSEFVTTQFLGHFYNTNSLDKCSICLRAKHTRDLFPSSLSNATAIFYLLHWDHINFCLLVLRHIS